MQPSRPGLPCSHTPALVFLHPHTLDNQNSPPTAVTVAVSTTPSLVSTKIRAHVLVPQALTKRQVKRVELDSTGRISSSAQFFPTQTYPLKSEKNVLWISSNSPDMGDSKAVCEKAVCDTSNASMAKAIEALQKRIDHDTETTSVLLVDSYKGDLPLLYAAAVRASSSAGALHVLSLFFENIITADLPAAVVTKKANTIVDIFFVVLAGQNKKMTSSVLSYLNLFLKTPLWNSVTHLAVNEFILERVVKVTPILAAQLSDPECYPSAIELLTFVASTSNAHAGQVLSVVSCDPAARLALSEALLMPDAFAYPNASGVAPIKLLSAIANQRGDFGELVSSLSNIKEKIVFAREYSCSSTHYFRLTDQFFTNILDAIKLITKTDLTLSIALLTAVVGNKSSVQACRYLAALEAKKLTDEFDKYFEILLSAAISLSSDSGTFIFASSALTVEVKRMFLGNLYQRPNLLLMDTEDKQYRDVHASNMLETFKDEARQMILQASPGAPEIELQRLTELLEISRNTTPLFVAARGFLENKIKAVIPEFFLAPIADETDETDETDKAGVMAYATLRQEYFVLYDTFLRNPEAEITPAFIQEELLRMATFPPDMKDVLKFLFSTYASQAMFKNTSILLDSKK